MALSGSVNDPRNVFPDQADLRGSIDDLGSASEVEATFQWRPVGGTLTDLFVGTFTSTTTVRETVTGLSPGTDYEYRLKIEDTGSTDSTTTSYKAFTAPTFSDEWGAEWDSNFSEFNIVSTTSPNNNEVIEMDSASEGRKAYQFTPPSPSSDVEVAGLTRLVSDDDTYNSWNRLYARGGGVAGSEDAYFAGVTENNGEYEGIIGKYNGGNFTTFFSGKTLSPYENEWYFTRFRVNGTDLKARWWPSSESEPASWDITVTDSDLADGWVGVGGYPSDVQQFDYISVATGGDTADLSNFNPLRNIRQTTSSNSYRIVDSVYMTQPITVDPTTDSATNVGSNSADLNGTMTTLEGYFDADFTFEYRQSGSSTWDNETSATTVSEGDSVTQSISGLNSATDYEFRSKAVGLGEGSVTGTGTINTFTTS